MTKSFKRIEIGEKSGDLTVVGREGMRGKMIVWKAQCSCGNHALLTSTTFRKQFSCPRCAWARGAQARVKHGDAKKSGERSSLYGIWQAMRNRCNNPNSRSYRWYGAKGISVCEAWTTSYVLFRDWAVANGFSPGMSIDRIDSLGPYEPDNCQWVTKSENSRLMREKYHFVLRASTDNQTAGLLSFGC